MAQLANLTTTLALESASFVNGINVSRSALSRLTRELDPAGRAQATFNRQINDAKKALDSGAISLDKYNFYVDAATKKLNSMIVAQKMGVGTSGQMRSGFQQLGYQLNDIATGLSTGQKASIVFSQQFSQVIQAVQLMNTESKGLLGVLGGPWGAVFAAALTVAAPFVAKLFEGGDSSDKLHGKTLDLVDALSKERFATSSARDALEEYNATKKNAINTDSLSTEKSLNSAKARLNEALATRELIKAELERERNAPTVTTYGMGANPSLAVAASALADQNDRIASLRETIRGLFKDVSDTAVKAVDPIEAINQKYKRMDDAAIEAASGNDKLSQSLSRTRVEIEKQRLAAVKAEQDRQSATRKQASDNRQSGRTISLSEAESIVQSIGGVITSATRSFQKQTELYNNYLAGKGPLAAKPGSSDHETGNALDIAKTPGISLGTIREAFNAAGVSIKQLLDEGNHFHVAWKAGADDAAKAEKKLDDTLKGVQTSLDPAAAAATNYQKALSDIATLQASGKLSPGKAKEYADAARDAFIDARAKAFSFKDIDFDDLIKQSEEADKKAQEEADRASKRADQAITDQKAQIGYAQQALGITTLNNNQRDIELARLSAIAELERLGTGYTEQQRQTLIAGAEALEKVRQQQELVNNSMQELNQFGDQFLSDVLNPDNWSSWGDLAKSVLKDIESEFIKLALLNPLKNALFGENNATLGSIGGLLGGIFKSGDSNLTAAADSFWSGGTPGFANGGSFMFGGKGGVDQNLLSLNGSPIARVSKGETATIGKGGSNDNRPIEIHIVGEESSAFVPRVTAISGVTSARVVGGAQKAQTKAAGRRLGR